MKLRAFLPAALACAVAGCSLLPGHSSKRTLEGAQESRIGVEELDGVTKNFADRYVQLVANACNSLKRNAPTPEARSRAHLIKLGAATGAWDMATDPHPVQQLVNLAVLVEFQFLVWAEERGLEKSYTAEGARPLVEAIVAAREDVHRLCVRALGMEQAAALKSAVRDWRAKHPAMSWITLIRFDTIAEGSNPIHGVLATLGSTLNSINPFDPVSDNIGSAQATLQRVFYYAKRLPMLLDWQTEAAVEHALDVPQVKEVTSTTARLLKELERWTKDGPEGALEPAKGLVVEARALSDAFRRVLEGIKDLKGEPGPAPDPNAEPSKPFDIDAYRAAAVEISKTAHETAELLREARLTIESPAAATLADQSAAAVARRGRELANHVALSVAGLLVLAAILWVGVRALDRRFAKRTPRPDPVTTVAPRPR